MHVYIETFNLYYVLYWLVSSVNRYSIYKDVTVDLKQQGQQAFGDGEFISEIYDGLNYLPRTRCPKFSKDVLFSSVVHQFIDIFELRIMVGLCSLGNCVWYP